MSHGFLQRSSLDFHKYIWIWDEAFLLLSSSSLSPLKLIVIPDPLYTYRSRLEKSCHCGWINKDVLCSLQWESKLKYLYYRIPCLSKEALVKFEQRFPKEIVKKWQRNEKKADASRCFVMSAAHLLTLQLKCHPPPRCQTKPDPIEPLALADFSGRLMFQV